MTVTALFLWTSISCFLLVGSDQMTVIEGECDEDDYDVHCVLADYFTECWLVCRLRTDDVTLVGEYSICQESRKSAVRSFKCIQGEWIPTDQHSPPTPMPRKKRWLWRGGSRRSVRTVTVTNYPPEITCPSDITVKASSGMTSARASWTVPTASDRNGGTPSVTRTEGDPPGSTFDEGSTKIEYTARDSTGLTDTCYFLVTVSVTYCSDSARQSFGPPGTQDCSGGPVNNIYGSVCVHQCPAGYFLQGSASVSCQSDGQWDHDFPSCQAVSCGDPGIVTGGDVSCPQGHVFEKSCVLQCRSGYQHTGVTSITCGSNGKWSSDLHPCLDVESPVFANGCPADLQLYSGPLESPVNVTWDDPVTTDNSGETVTLTSDPVKGSLLGVGSHTVEVKATDAGGNKASCVFIVNVQAKQCQQLFSPAHGHVTCTSGHVEGSECTVECSYGYRLQGLARLTCLETELWDVTMPTCEVILCPTPPYVEDGTFECLSGHQYPAVCTLTCDPGYVVMTSDTIQCQENETWTSPGECRDVEIPHFVNGCPPDQHLFASRLGEETLVFWTPPDVTDNSDDSINVTSDFNPGTSFPPGVTTVTYTATDLTGNTETCQFSVNVSVLQCKAPEEAISNQMELTFSCPDEHVHGARCTLACTQGYSLPGEKAVVCERDNNTHPPTMHWEGAVGALGHPKCIVDNCLPLSPPQNGALSCLMGEVGWDCVFHCDAAWDLSASTGYFDGHLFCNSEKGIWRPSQVPDCVVWHHPLHVRVRSSLFYLTDSCETSLDAVRDKFITRLTQSIFKTACVGVPTCSAHNVEVTCGPVTRRGKRAVDVQSRSGEDWMERVQASQRRRRSPASHYVLVTFHMQIHVLDSPQSAESAYQEFQSTHDRLMQSLKFHAVSGQLSLDNLRADDFSLGPSSVVADCPPGTLLRPDHRSSQRFACVGCSKGYFLAVNGTVCQQCPVGSYSEVDNATACMPCPAGWSTSDTASQHRSQCQVVIP